LHTYVRARACVDYTRTVLGLPHPHASRSCNMQVQHCSCSCERPRACMHARCWLVRETSRLGSAWPGINALTGMAAWPIPCTFSGQIRRHRPSLQVPPPSTPPAKSAARATPPLCHPLLPHATVDHPSLLRAIVPINLSSQIFSDGGDPLTQPASEFLTHETTCASEKL
jgi:hypothetical protein